VLGLLVAGVTLAIGVAVVGLVGAVLSLVFGIVFLPFKLLGLAFRGIGVVLALPFLAAFGILGLVIFGVGALIFLMPALPFVALVFALIWLVRRGMRPARA